MATRRGLSSTLLMSAHLDSPSGPSRRPRSCMGKAWRLNRANVDAAQ